MTEFIHPSYQGLVDWFAQPAPSFEGDTHALYFWLTNRESSANVAYQGFLFFKEATNPEPHMRPHRVSGIGRVVGNAGYVQRANQGPDHVPHDWVRVEIPLRPAGASVSLSFCNTGPNGLVGESGLTLEYDLRNPDDPGTSSFPNALQHSETGATEWSFNFVKTTQMLTPPPPAVL